MELTCKPATRDDVEELVRLYRLLEDEMTALSRQWPMADGLPEPVETSFKEKLSDPEALILIGGIDEVPLGFLLAETIPLLPQAGGRRAATIRLIFTQPEARGVGLGEVMMELALRTLEDRGVDFFDAVVPPGHRDAKNFFEASGFSARSIVMHRRDG